MLRFHEITDANDPLLIPWLELYELAFPPEERMLVSSFLETLKEKQPNSRLQAATNEQGRFVALLRYDLLQECGAAYLWYLAVSPEARSGGVGSECFAEVVRQASEAGLKAVVFEVEIPEECEGGERQDLARRRIEFYRRQGCKLLGGIRYIQQLPHQPPIPLHIMVRAIEHITPQEALDMARALLEDVTQVGELELA